MSNEILSSAQSTEETDNGSSRLNIYQKLAKIRRPVEILQKNKKGFGYTYVTEDAILAKITGLMNTLGVSLIPNITPGTTIVTQYPYVKTKSTKDGKIYDEKVNEILVQCDMTWNWVNNDNPSDRIIVPWSAVGQQADASQAFGSGLSYASRYFLLKYFNVSTSDDDPDAWRTQQREAESMEAREVSEKIVEKVHEMVTARLEKIPDDKQKIAAIIKKYAKENGKATANYYTIQDPLVASALLDELTKVFAEEPGAILTPVENK